MHELSIALSIVELAAEEAEQRGVRIAAVHLALGPLSGVAREALLGSYEMAAAGTTLEGSRLVVTEVPIVVFCAACNQPRSLPTMQLFRCPECGAPTPQVLEGDQLHVTGLELEEAAT